MTRLRIMRRAASHPRVAYRSWIAMVAIPLMVAAEYRFSGGRSQTSAWSGSADKGTAIEIVVVAIAGIVLLFAVPWPPRQVRAPALIVVLWGFTLAMGLVAFWSPYPLLAAVRALQLIMVAWFAQLIGRFGTRAQLWRLCHAFILLVSVSILVGVAVHHPPTGQEGRFTWLYMHPNISGAFVGISTTVVVACLLRRQAGAPEAPWPIWAYSAALVLNAGALLATRSRGSLAGAVAGLILLGWSASRRRSRIDLTVVGVSSVAIVWLLASGDILTYLARGDTTAKLETLNSRTEVWNQGLQLFGDRPWFGHGFMSARGAFLNTFGLGGAHNALVEVLVNAGLFGTVWWLALLFVAFKVATRLTARRHPDGPLLLGILGFLVVNALTAGELAQAATVQSMWLFIVVGWLVGISTRHEETVAVAKGSAESPSREQIVPAFGSGAQRG